MVSEDARYSSAGAELAARIQARDLVLVSYIAFSGTVLSLGLAKPSVALMSLAIPYLAVAAALLNAHHDAIIGLLSRYMRALEKSGSGAKWHTDRDYIGRALRARLVRDFAAVVFFVLSSVAGLWVTKAHLETAAAMSQTTVFWWGGVLCVGVIIIVFVGLYCYRHEIWPFKQGET